MMSGRAPSPSGSRRPSQGAEELTEASGGPLHIRDVGMEEIPPDEVPGDDHGTRSGGAEQRIDVDEARAGHRCGVLERRAEPAVALGERRHAEVARRDVVRMDQHARRRIWSPAWHSRQVAEHGHPGARRPQSGEERRHTRRYGGLRHRFADVARHEDGGGSHTTCLRDLEAVPVITEGVVTATEDEGLFGNEWGVVQPGVH